MPIETWHEALSKDIYMEEATMFWILNQPRSMSKKRYTS
jgi:hypothetical protein